MKNLLRANLEDGTNLRNSLDKALHVLRFTTHSELQKLPFELHFGRKPRTRLTNLKNVIPADSKDLSVYITRNSTGEITNHQVMSKKKTTDPKYRRAKTFSQTRKPLNTVSMNKYPFSFYEKSYKTKSLGSKFNNKIQVAVSGTKHTVTTDKNKVIHRKLISNPLPFQNSTTPTKRISTRQATAEQPSCSKPTETCTYRRKEPPKSETHENSDDWIRRKDQPRNEKGQFTSPQKNTGMTDLDLSIVSDEEFNCYNNSEGRPISVNVEDELQIHPKETRLSPETGINHGHIKNKATSHVRRSSRLPFAKQTEKLGGIPYQTNNNLKRNKQNCDLLQEKRTTPLPNSEEEEDRNIRTKEEINRIIRNHYKSSQQQTHVKKGECDMQRSQPKKSNRVVVKQTHKQLNKTMLYLC